MSNCLFKQAERKISIFQLHSIALFSKNNFRYALTEQKRELQILKEMVRTVRHGGGAVRGIQDQMEDDEIVRWAGTLPRARVTRWGGMISTPDAVLQEKLTRMIVKCCSNKLTWPKCLF